MSDTPKIELVQGEIASVSLKPGDRLVLMFKETLGLVYRERLRHSWEQWAPDVPCLVLDGGVRLAVIRQELTPDSTPRDPEG